VPPLIKLLYLQRVTQRNSAPPAATGIFQQARAASRACSTRCLRAYAKRHALRAAPPAATLAAALSIAPLRLVALLLLRSSSSHMPRTLYEPFSPFQRLSAAAYGRAHQVFYLAA